MSRWIFLAEEKKDLQWLAQHDLPAVHVDDYLTGAQSMGGKRNIHLLNLCRSSRYLSIGYYASLLAEARHHDVLPSVSTLLDVSRRGLIRLRSDLLETSRIRTLLNKYASKEDGLQRFEMNVYFGRCAYPELAEIARQAYELFPAPLLRVLFQRSRQADEWALEDLRLLTLPKIPRTEASLFLQQVAIFTKQRQRRTTKASKQARFDLAILVDAEERLAPSDEGALKKFERAGRALGLHVERINRRDYTQLAKFDALFIRETTGINHHTYRFAKKAERGGMVVIDDPTSILRCTNKVYLAELLRANRVPTPTSIIAGPQDLDGLEQALGYPMVLKIPDGSFSLGVELVKDREQLEQIASELFAKSELILGQEFLYTEYDWRIGILAGRPLYACQYFMSKRNWKIVEHQADGGVRHGRWKTYPIEQAPPDIVATALHAANLIGDGLYGVDLKQTTKGPVVIEVNDIPSIDSGVEDQVLKDQLYREIMGEFLRRLEIRVLSGSIPHK